MSLSVYLLIGLFFAVISCGIFTVSLINFEELNLTTNEKLIISLFSLIAGFIWPISIVFFSMYAAVNLVERRVNK